MNKIISKSAYFSLIFIIFYDNVKVPVEVNFSPHHHHHHNRNNNNIKEIHLEKYYQHNNNNNKYLSQ